MLALRDDVGLEAVMFAEIGNYVLYAASATDERMRAAPLWMSKTSWFLKLGLDSEMTIGGPAEDIEQAKLFATKAYQATQGLIVGGDA